MKNTKSNPFYAPAQSEPEALKRAEKLKLLGQSEIDGALDTAIRFRDVLQARILLKSGANPNGRDMNNVSVLGHAIGSKHFASLDLLLQHGADPNLKTGLATPLINAIYEEQWDMVHRLLLAKADVNATGVTRSTALHVAVKHKRDPKLVKTLLEHGARVTAKDAAGLTSLDWAKRNADDQVIRVLQQATKAKARRKTL